MRVLDLFSGTGGFSAGLQRAGMKTVAFCEIDPFCRARLKDRWPGVPIYNDVRKLNAERLQSDGIGKIDVVAGGFPCQPYSCAGRKKGTHDYRDLWPEMCRIIEETKPAWVIGENVADFTDMAFTRTKIDLESRGYEVQPFIIPACGVGAAHLRYRIWIIAHANRERLQAPRKKQRPARVKQFGFLDRRAIELHRKEISDRWLGIEPGIRGGIHGASRRSRIMAAGNGVYPLIPEIIGRGIVSIERSI